MSFLLELISGELSEHQCLLGCELPGVKTGSGGGSSGERNRRAAQTVAREPTALQQRHRAPPAVHGALSTEPAAAHGEREDIGQARPVGSWPGSCTPWGPARHGLGRMSWSEQDTSLPGFAKVLFHSVSLYNKGYAGPSNESNESIAGNENIADFKHLTMTHQFYTKIHTFQGGVAL